MVEKSKEGEEASQEKGTVNETGNNDFAMIEEDREKGEAQGENADNENKEGD